MNAVDEAPSTRRSSVQEPYELTVTAGEQDGALVVTLAGELDIATVPRLTAALDRAGDPAMLVLDLRELSLVDSVGLRELLRADQRARRDGRRVVLAVGDGKVARVIRLTRLDRRLTLADSPEDALAGR